MAGSVRKLLSTVAALLLAACATPSTVPEQARDELAPNGKVRAGINYGNAVLARRDLMTGEMRGVAVDLARELGRRLGRPVELVGYDGAGKLLAGVAGNEWDVGFLAYDPARTNDVAFTAPYMQVEVTYAVPAGSAVRDVSGVDREGTRLAVQSKSAADLFLSREIKQATLVRASSAANALRTLKEGSAEVAAANKQELLTFTEANPGFRIVEGRFSTIDHAMVVPRAHTQAATYVRGFAEDVKRSGFVQRALQDAGIRGVVVAPAAVDGR